MYTRERVITELEDRSRRQTIEMYLEQVPELSISAGLLHAEYEVRRFFGVPTSLTDFAQRFPPACRR